MLRANLVPRALFPGFGGGPRPQSQGKAPWGRGWLRARYLLGHLFLLKRNAAFQ